MGKSNRTGAFRAKRSIAWSHFDSLKGWNKCKHCAWSTPLKKDGCTNSMLQHLRKHDISSPWKADVQEAMRKIRSIELPDYCKTEGEWLVLMLVQDGFNFHQIANSLFVKAAFHYMKLQHYISHKGVRAKAFEQIGLWKNEVKADIRASKEAGVRYAAMFDEWTSISTKRYMNICLSSSKQTTIGLGMVRCIGSITSGRTIEMVKDRLAEYGIEIPELVGVSSDGANVMKRTGLDMNIPHQMCLGKKNNII